MMEAMSYGDIPERDEFINRVDVECPDGYQMVIRNQEEWVAIVEIINRGIDSHLEAVFCDADNTTGEIKFKDGASLYTFIRRTVEDPPECGEDGCTKNCFNESYDGEHCCISRIMGLASSILYSLDYEWV